jgi:hypothetical protein
MKTNFYSIFFGIPLFLLCSGCAYDSEKGGWQIAPLWSEPCDSTDKTIWRELRNQDSQKKKREHERSSQD